MNKPTLNISLKTFSWIYIFNTIGKCQKVLILEQILKVLFKDLLNCSPHRLYNCFFLLSQMKNTWPLSDIYSGLNLAIINIISYFPLGTWLGTSFREFKKISLSHWVGALIFLINLFILCTRHSFLSLIPFSPCYLPSASPTTYSSSVFIWKSAAL